MLVAAVAALILAFGARNQVGEIGGVPFTEIADVTWRASLVVAIGALVFLIYRGQLIDALRTILVWVGLASVIAFAYNYRADLLGLGHRVVGWTLPSTLTGNPGEAPQVELTRTRSGDFTVRADVNGRRVPMIVDTGATAVVLTVDAAKAAGLPLDFLRYDVVVETANGRTKAASIVIEKLTVGDIVARRVPALVAESGNSLKTSLLGMTFLNRLDSYEVRGDRLVLRGRPSS
ncbi:putative aspartyl protease [Blastochloris viridis]|uniref:Putative aspartyl protease n=1 Tax=Blastochloris viridis TaxID=1079 RepID=A0A0S4PYC1_BLAVI|nr:putative aspartyl protease [Blastochloris viridis]